MDEFKSRPFTYLLDMICRVYFMKGSLERCYGNMSVTNDSMFNNAGLLYLENLTNNGIQGVPKVTPPL